MKRIKRALLSLSIVCISLCCLTAVGAIEPRALIEYNTMESTAKFTGSLGYADFTSTCKYNTSTKAKSISSKKTTGHPKSGYTYNGGSGVVTTSGSTLKVIWSWQLKDSNNNVVDSGTETHNH